MMKMTNRKLPITTTIEPRQYEQLLELSERTGISRSHMIREGIDLVIRRFESMAKVGDGAHEPEDR